MPIRILTRPMPDQVEGVRQIEEKFKGRFLLADDMGLGKTAQVLYWHARNRMATTQWPKVIVCPAAVKGETGWAAEAKKHIGINATILDTQTPYDFTHEGLVIINYDILPYWVAKLKEMNPQSVIGDECQYLVNRKTGRTKAFIDLCHGVPYVGGASGSPFMNGPFELYPMLHILRPDVYWFKSPMFFGFQFCKPRRENGEWIFPGSQNEEELNNLLLDEVMIRRLRENRVQTRVINVDIDNRDEYNHAKGDLVGWLRTHDTRKARRAGKAEAYVKLNYLRQIVARGKLAAVVGRIQKFLTSTNEKVVVYAWHRKMIEEIRARVGFESTSIMGGISRKDRDYAVSRFQKDSKCRLMVNNLQSGGVGLNGLQFVSNNIFHTEISFRPKDHEQADCRLDRHGQTEPMVWSRWLVVGDTVEQRLCEIVQNKDETFRSIMDGGAANRDERDGVLDLLLEAMARDM